jgi:hypothetical protein
MSSVAAAPNVEVVFQPWMTSSCPKSWGAYGPSERCIIVLHEEPPVPQPEPCGWYVHVAVDDDLAKVDVEARSPEEGEEEALRQLLPMLEALDVEMLNEKQQATRTRAIKLMKELLA